MNSWNDAENAVGVGVGSRLGVFQTTQWSLVARAGGAEGRDDDQRRRDALATILTRYLPALRAHLLARGHRQHQADDLLQSFVADRVIERNLLARADRGRGRFRSFLLASLDNFVANARRRENAAKRAPAGRYVLALDPENGLDPAADDVGETTGSSDAFDVAWAREAMAEALRRTRDGCLADSRPDLWDVLEARILAPALDDAEPVSYEVLVERHGYRSWKHAANVLVTAKRRFQQALRWVLSEHVKDERELESELSGLGAALAAIAMETDGQRDA